MGSVFSGCGSFLSFVKEHNRFLSGSTLGRTHQLDQSVLLEIVITMITSVDNFTVSGSELLLFYFILFYCCLEQSHSKVKRTAIGAELTSNI